MPHASAVELGAPEYAGVALARTVAFGVGGAGELEMEHLVGGSGGEDAGAVEGAVVEECAEEKGEIARGDPDSAVGVGGDVVGGDGN